MNPTSILKKFRYIGGFSVLVFCFWTCNPSNHSVNRITGSNPKMDLPKTHSGLKDSLVLSGNFDFQKNNRAFGLYTSADSTWVETLTFLDGHWSKPKYYKLKTLGKILKASTIKIKDSTFLSLISLNSKKGPSSNLFFSLVDPIRSCLYSIRFRYFQTYSNLAAKYQMEDSLKKHRDIVHALEGESARYILGFDKVYKNPNIKDSLIKRWVMLNDRVYEETANAGKSFQLNSEEFQGDLAPGLRNFQNNDSLFKKNVSLAENGQYKIASAINGPVYGYNKGQNRGFILWVPDEPDHFIRTVQIRGNHVLFYDSILTPKSKLKPQYDYDLGQKVIKKLK